ATFRGIRGAVRGARVRSRLDGTPARADARSRNDQGSADMSCADTILERVVCVTVLGLRFWDPVSNSAVGKGLKVEAYPQGESSRRIGSFLSIGGFHAFRGLPGMREVETGAVELDLAQRRPFVIEVSDLTGRFLPFSITTPLPVTGFFPWDMGP